METLLEPNDSRISSDIAYDLTVAIREIGEGIREAHELSGIGVNCNVCALCGECFGER